MGITTNSDRALSFRSGSSCPLFRASRSQGESGTEAISGNNFSCRKETPNSLSTVSRVNSLYAMGGSSDEWEQLPNLYLIARPLFARDKFIQVHQYPRHDRPCGELLRIHAPCEFGRHQ